MLNSSDFVPRSSVIFGDFGFNYDHRIEFARDNKVRCLVKSGDFLGAFRLPVANPVLREDIFDLDLETVSDQFADRVSVTSKRASQKAFVKEHCVWCP